MPRVSGKRFGYAARDVRHPASLARRVADDDGIDESGGAVGRRCD